ncbi:MAG: methyltransferase, partial [Myxococcota bacterium]
LVELARGAQMTPAQMRRLLDAAVSLGLLQRRGSERYGLGMLGAALRGNPGVISMIEHHPMLYRDLEDPVRLLQGRHGKTELGQFWAYSSSQAPGTLAGEKVAEYSRLMAESQQFIAGDVLEAYDFSRHRRLMDVGGGEGAFLHEASKRNEDLSLMLFDLPAVAERARERLSPLGDRVSVVGGDLFSDRLPEGADAISLVRIVHDHDDGAAMAILRAVHRALPPGGTLILAEPMAGTRGALPMGDAYFGFYLLAMGHGRPRTPEELTQMLENAGFERPKQVRTRRPMLTQLIVARRA